MNCMGLVKDRNGGYFKIAVLSKLPKDISVSCVDFPNLAVVVKGDKVVPIQINRNAIGMHPVSFIFQNVIIKQGIELIKYGPLPYLATLPVQHQDTISNHGIFCGSALTQ